MSVYTLNIGRTIQNDTASNPDISLQNIYDSTVVGYLAGVNNKGTYNVFLGNSAGKNNKTGSSNTFLGTVAGFKNTVGNVNTFIGTGAGYSNIDGMDNVYLGYKAGFKNQSGKGNVMIGNNSGQFNQGNNNVFIGFNNTNTINNINSSNNTSIGPYSIANGYQNNVLGYSNLANISDSLLLGNLLWDLSSNSILMGKNIKNLGANSFIFYNGSNQFLNTQSNIINFNNAFVISSDSQGIYDKFQSILDNFLIGNCNNTINITKSNIRIASSNDIFISNNTSFVKLEKDLTLSSYCNVFVNGSNIGIVSSNNIVMSNNTSFVKLEKDLTLSSYCNVFVNGSNIGIIGSNIQLLGSSNIGIVSSNNIVMSNNTSFVKLEKDLTLSSYCNMYFESSNNFFMKGSNIILEGYTLDLSHFSNINFPSGLPLSKDGTVTVCCSNKITIDDIYKDRIVNHLDGSAIIENNLFVYSNIVCKKFQANVVSIESCEGLTLSSSNRILFDTPLAIAQNNLNVKGDLKLGGSQCYWEISNNHNSNNDLVFKSCGGTLITFVDEFCPEILNFTGKHRCFPSNYKFVPDLEGMIVVSDGKYMNLQNEKSISIDEAIPMVKLAKKSKDKRVFGVIGGTDKEGKFKVGNMYFKTKHLIERYIIQSLGEGGIWVCNINGSLENGDYITSSILKGYGMKQKSNVKKNYTVAKITCDCDFDKMKKIKIVKFDGMSYKCAFVGCAYNCS